MLGNLLSRLIIRLYKLYSFLNRFRINCIFIRICCRILCSFLVIFGGRLRVILISCEVLLIRDKV